MWKVWVYKIDKKITPKEYWNTYNMFLFDMILEEKHVCKFMALWSIKRFMKFYNIKKEDSSCTIDYTNKIVKFCFNKWNPREEKERLW